MISFLSRFKLEDDVPSGQSNNPGKIFSEWHGEVKKKWLIKQYHIQKVTHLSM